jgi:hypothetical protein
MWSWDGMRDGSITVTFRRWKRPQAVAGRPYRTPVGIIDVTAVDVITEADITPADAAASGLGTVDGVLAALRGDPALPIYRLRFHLAEGPDPRAKLAATADLSEDDRAELDRRLARLDKASKVGPWTRPTLELIARRPEVRAGDLAEELGRAPLQDFKLDVRKLKALGLTISHPVGYTLSPRGQAYLAGLRGGEPV